MREIIIEAEWEEIRDVAPIDPQVNKAKRKSTSLYDVAVFVSGAFFGAFMLSKTLEMIFY